MGGDERDEVGDELEERMVRLGEAGKRCHQAHAALMAELRELLRRLHEIAGDAPRCAKRRRVGSQRDLKPS